MTKKELQHAERLRRHNERLNMLEELWRYWEPRRCEDPEYVKELAERVRYMRNRVAVMKI